MWDDEVDSVARDPLVSRPLISIDDLMDLEPTGLDVWDKVIGGWVAGGLVLLAGEPAAGKTTLALKLCESASGARTPAFSLFASAEEGGSAIRTAAVKLGLESPLVRFMEESNLELILTEADRIKPLRLLVVNSLNTTIEGDGASGAGTPTQILKVAYRLHEWVIDRPTMVVLIGHITWKNRSAGPRRLEHAVDAVLYMRFIDKVRMIVVRKGRPPFRGFGSCAIPDWAVNSPTENLAIPKAEPG